MSCRACQSSRLEEVVDMGKMPLAGDFHSGSQAKRYPLAVDHCLACGVLQVRELVPHEVLFNQQYCYDSATIPSLVRHFEGLAGLIKQHVCCEFSGKKVTVLEIGANSGVLLAQLDKLGIENIGVDASQNVVNLAQEKGCACECVSFSSKTAGTLLKYAINGYEVVTCSNVFAHNEDPNDFLEGVKQVLAPNGLLVIEVHNSAALFAETQWDCFYHEHCFYWSAESLMYVLNKKGFYVYEAKEIPMHGGGIRVLAKLGCSSQNCTKGFLRPSWNVFREKAYRSRNILHDTLCSSFHREKDSNLFLYGAAGRAVTLINWAGIGEQISGAFDGSALRIGKTIPGTEIAIWDERQLVNFSRNLIRPYLLLGAWHIAASLIKKVREEFRSDPYFITPLPTLKIL